MLLSCLSWWVAHAGEIGECIVIFCSIVCLWVGWFVCFFVHCFSLFHCLLLCLCIAVLGKLKQDIAWIKNWNYLELIRFKISIISKSFFIVFSFEVVRLYAQLVLQRSLHQKRKCTPAPFPMGPMFPMGPNVNKCQYASGPKEIMSEMAKLSKNFTRTKIQGMWNLPLVNTLSTSQAMRSIFHKISKSPSDWEISEKIKQ